MTSSRPAGLRVPTEVLDPPPVRPGDRVGVAALSGRVDPARLERGVEGLRQLGYEPVLAANVLRHDGLFAGSEDERLDGFHRLAADASIRAITFARGGHGMLRLIDRLDWDLLSQEPRPYVGYSDLAPFLQQVVLRLGYVAYHGPMVAADLARGIDADEATSLRDALEGRPWRALSISRWTSRGRGDGVAEGTLLGGCLSLFSDTVGTAWETRFGRSIAFFEEVDEGLYKVDRMLRHLSLSGTLSGVAGILFGHVDWRVSAGGQPPSEASIDHCLSWLGREVAGPIGWGVPAGHRAPNWTLPLGARVRADAASGVVERI
jgi:muramoyltetrapeptide carboxypeptidase